MEAAARLLGGRHHAGAELPSPHVPCTRGPLAAAGVEARAEPPERRHEDAAAAAGLLVLFGLLRSTVPSGADESIGIIGYIKVTDPRAGDGVAALRLHGHVLSLSLSSCGRSSQHK